MQLCNQCNVFLLCLTETDDKMRAFAESVFASETKGEDIRDEISMFDVPEDCPILQNEMAHHLHTEDNTEKRCEESLCMKFFFLIITCRENKVLYSDPWKRGDLNSLGQMVGCHKHTDILTVDKTNY